MRQNIVLMLICCFWLAACDEKITAPGILATVNGEEIHLHAAQALIDSRTAAMGVAPQPSVAEMRKTYRDAVAVLIAHALVRQELAEKGLAVTEEELEQSVERIKQDYGEEELEKYLDQTVLREEEWRELLRDHLSLQAFVSRILAPSIHITLDELKNWYAAHKEQFQQPEMWHVCLKSAATQEDVENWCANLPVDNPAEENCMAVTSKDIPDPWSREVARIRLPGCGKIIQQEGQWRTVAALSRMPARTAQMSEVYPLLERALLEEKKQAAFEEWLGHRLAASQILSYPGLFTSGDARP